MKRAFGLTLALALACSTAVASTAQTSASVLLKQIDEQGAKATVSSMSESQWDAVLDRVDSGSPEWVALVPKLAKGTDGGNSEDLGIGLAYALPKNPKAVLKAIDPDNGPVLGVSRVCSAPFIEDTVPDIPAYIKHARAALNKVRDPALQGVKKACMAELAKP
ncbi:hypothetical protein PQQ75_04155 [Paraburkholderia aspalathi]|uniref:hypothetical protein n=1 Tax=Paraburkholderia aspalathi TaxID=1324617 RepID=UPI0038BBD36A